jgi:hypothetical protein
VAIEKKVAKDQSCVDWFEYSRCWFPLDLVGAALAGNSALFAWSAPSDNYATA